MGAETRTRKEIAEAFRQKYDPNTGKGKIRKGILPNDDPDEIIPKRGPRGKSQHYIPLSDRLSHASQLSRGLIAHIDTQTRKDGNYGIDSTLINYPLVVVDTSVIARAIATEPRLDCWGVIEACIAENSTPCVTDSIIAEYQRVVGLGTPRDGIHFDQNSKNLLKKFLARCLVLVGNPTTRPLQVLADNTDQKFLNAQALAQERMNNPCYIASLDDHLLKIGPALETRIMHPATFLSFLAHSLLVSQLGV